MMTRRNPTDEFIEKGLRPGDEFQVGAIRPEVELAPVRRVYVRGLYLKKPEKSVPSTLVLIAAELAGGLEM